MFLKTLKLSGFKSFVDPTVVHVKNGMNAVVGPNGCGKSNIVDAIRWVVGESSAKQLRGQAMTDVIFNGTTSRKPVGKACVELIFDNSDGKAGGEYAKYNELAIRRDLSRDGQSTYFINGAVCRRRDIIDIFLGTGLGPRSYAVIEQGMITRLVEAKPEEFRVFLEEAAGISKYKDRRRDTENRMQRTQDNLDRVNDISEELGKQLKRLKRQANAAEQYKSLQAESRQCQAEIHVMYWSQLDAAQQTLATRRQALQSECDAIQTDLHQLHTQIEKNQLSQVEASDALNQAQADYYAMASEITRLEQQLKDQHEQARHLAQELEAATVGIADMQHALTAQQDSLNQLDQEIAQQTAEQSRYVALVEDASEQLSTTEVSLATCQQTWEAQRQVLAELNQQLQVSDTKQHHLAHQIEEENLRKEKQLAQLSNLSLQAFEETLPELEKTYQAEAQAVADLKEQLQQLRDAIVAQRTQNDVDVAERDSARATLQRHQARYDTLKLLQDNALSGGEKTVAWLSAHQLSQCPRLGESIVVEDGWQDAVESVLGHYLDAVCVPSLDSLLGKMDIEEGALMLVQAQSAQPLHATATEAQLALPTLASKVRANIPFFHCLRDVFVVATLDDALATRDQLQSHQSMITADGLWMGQSWARRVRPQMGQTGVLAREQDLKALADQIEQQSDALSQLADACVAGQQALVQLESEQTEAHQAFQSHSQRHATASAALAKQQAAFEAAQRQEAQLREAVALSDERVASLRAQSADLLLSFNNLTDEEQVKHQAHEVLTSERQALHDVVLSQRAAKESASQARDVFMVSFSSNQQRATLLRESISQSAQQLEHAKVRERHLAERYAQCQQPDTRLDDVLQDKVSQQMKNEQILAAAKQALNHKNDQHVQTERRRTELQNALDHVKDQLQTIAVEAQALLVRKTTYEEQLASSDHDLETLKAALPEEASLPEWEASLEKIAQKIHRLGAINLAAIEEYQHIQERKTFLDQQQADLTEALDILQGAIRRIDQETRHTFKTTFDRVNADYQALFPKIFGGGRASLSLDSDNLLETGVAVHAQPPGKRNATIQMLSGGEKALTAIALVFALFRLNPAPFCVLDEVDAPLDDVNVGRFCQLVQEMAKMTQFIVISHNKVTIEMADFLMGITMQEAGVSRVVSVDMAEALSLVEA